ncbi:MAG: hypothetical protein F4093_01965 [Gammaproteobacteria bacterium]|nr:hypothetical protein [Gammaproteobacteria bacterium]MYJ51432.1 hypothetical protein [Gammaproteobacteria bacterium]
MGATRYARNRFPGLSKAMMKAYRQDESSPKPDILLFSGKAFTRLGRETDWLLDLSAHPIKYTLKYPADACKRRFRINLSA